MTLMSVKNLTTYISNKKIHTTRTRDMRLSIPLAIVFSVCLILATVLSTPALADPVDTDGDGYADISDEFPSDPNKATPSITITSPSPGTTYSWEQASVNIIVTFDAKPDFDGYIAYVTGNTTFPDSGASDGTTVNGTIINLPTIKNTTVTINIALVDSNGDIYHPSSNTSTSFSIENQDILDTIDLSSLGTLLLWLDADDPSTLSIDGSNNVLSWTDKSDNEFVLSDVRPEGNRPVLLADGINGKPSVHLQAKGDNLYLDIPEYTNDSLTVFMVVEEDTDEVGKQILAFYDVEETRPWSKVESLIISTAGTKAYRMLRTNNNNILDAGTSTSYDNIFGATIDASGVKGFINGYNYITAANAGNFGFEQITLGIAYNKFSYIPDNSATPELGEIIVFEEALSDERRELVENYLAYKWGIESQGYLEEINSDDRDGDGVIDNQDAFPNDFLKNEPEISFDYPEASATLNYQTTSVSVSINASIASDFISESEWMFNIGSSVGPSGTGTGTAVSLNAAGSFNVSENNTYTIYARLVDLDNQIITSANEITRTVSIASNSAPVISNLNDFTASEETLTTTSFTVSNDSDLESNLSVTINSISDTTILPTANITFSGTTSTRVLSILGDTDQYGVVDLVIQISDGSLISTEDVRVTINNVNDSPSITALTDITISTLNTTIQKSFTINDSETAAESLTLSKESSDIAVLPLSGIIFGGSGSSRTVDITPENYQYGTVTVTLNVGDGTVTASRTFSVTVEEGDLDSDGIRDTKDAYPEDAEKLYLEGDISVNNLSVNPDSSIKFTIKSHSDYDTLAVSGTFEAYGTLEIATSNFEPSIGQTYSLFNASSGVTGTFKDMELPKLEEGKAWNLENLYTNGEIKVQAISAQIPSGLYAWFDGSDNGTISVTQDTKVQSWVDKTGKNFIALQADTSKMPSLVSNGLNSHTTVSFDGTNDYLSMGTNFKFTDSVTIYVVAKFDETGEASGQTLVGNNQFSISKSGSSNNNKLEAKVRFSNDSTTSQVSEKEPDTGYTIFGATFDGSTLKLLDGGTEKRSTFGTNAISANQGTAAIGAGSGLTIETSYFNGDIAEILIFNRQLTEPERKRLEKHLNAKWKVFTNTYDQGFFGSF